MTYMSLSYPDYVNVIYYTWMYLCRLKVWTILVKQWTDIALLVHVYAISCRVVYGVVFLEYFLWQKCRVGAMFPTRSFSKMCVCMSELHSSDSRPTACQYANMGRVFSVHILGVQRLRIMYRLLYAPQNCMPSSAFIRQVSLLMWNIVRICLNV